MVRLAHKVAARFVRAREFSSPEALKEYLKAHPNADKSKHTVKKPEKAPAKAESPKSKGLFPADEVAKLPDSAAQPTKSPDKLFKEAKKAHQHQLQWLNQGKGLDSVIGASVIRADKGDPIDFDQKGPVILIGPMKKQERAKEKVEADFGGDWSKLSDIVRASVAVDSFDDLEGVVKTLKERGLKLARKPKDRFAKPTSAGYRDILMNVTYPNGHVGELQLHLKSVLKAKDAGHKLYEDVRSIEAAAKKEGRDTLTEEEQKTVDEANRKMRELYEKAWNKATTKKTAMDKTAASTKYYEYKDLPAYQEHRKFPKVVTPTGERTVYELEDFYTEASPISKSEFEKLKGKTKKASIVNRVASRFQGS